MHELLRPVRRSFIRISTGGPSRSKTITLPSLEVLTRRVYRLPSEYSRSAGVRLVVSPSGSRSMIRSPPPCLNTT